MAKNSKFGAAFKAAKASGKKEFSFGGKKYNTKTAPSLPKNGPNPGAGRPATKSEISSAMSKTSAAIKAKEAATKSSNTPIPAKNGTGTKAKPQAMANIKGAAAKVAADVKSIGPSRTTSVTPKSKSENKSTGGYTGITARSGFSTAPAKSSSSKTAYDARTSLAAKKASMGPPAPTMAQKAANKSTVGKSPVAVKNQSKK